MRIRGWRRTALIGIPLIYAVYVIGAVSQYSHGQDAMAGYTIVAAFCLCFVAFGVLESQGPLSAPRFWLLYGLLIALFAVEVRCSLPPRRSCSACMSR